ncbi:adenylosuccinate lyase [Candidatus Woesearchaeota archaeon CG08_land_8_20_14_0_20_43_7]|nr:MAG: adenylosuccinate lyase [Candidatus Woesearchaeota archaeon CG08_land_8_20_14_0_20_43_7]
MEDERKIHVNPLIKRYASSEMSELFSEQKRFSTWRKCWLALAEAEKELGLDIEQPQLDEMRDNIDNIDYAEAEKKEKELRHDVLAHIHAFGKVCPKAKPIIHLGATSCFVTDNSDQLIFKEGLQSIAKRLANLIDSLSKFADENKDVATLGFTHFQSAQPVTVGKRATLWIQDFVIDLKQIEHFIDNIELRGAKGTTGTQASYLELFDGDQSKVKELDRLVAKKLGMKSALPVTGQTYTRKLDTMMLNALSGIAESAHKFSNDIRLLQHLKEIEEPFAKKQKGSSAMAYKRNPIRTERIASLSRMLILAPQNMAMTQATQWLERSLDDSAIRRIVIPQSFLLADAILNICLNVSEGLVVYKKIIKKHIQEELPFIATENIIMHCVSKGGDRQALHTQIRDHSMEAARRIKEEGLSNDLLERIASDKNIDITKEEIAATLDIKKFIGRAPEQVTEFIESEVTPIRKRYKASLGMKSELKV